MHGFRSAFVVIFATLLAACGGSSNGGGPDAAPSADAPPSTPDASTTPGVAAIPLSSPDGTLYTAQLTIGTQQFAMVVDTGSTTAGVAGADCTGCNVTPLYAPGSSATDKQMPANAQFGSGSWSGEIWNDQMGLGVGTPLVGVDLVSISSQKTFFDGNQNLFQGLLGLGGDGLLVNGTSSYLDEVVKAGIADIQAFEMCDSGGGTMWLGGFDANAAGADPLYTPMNKQLPYYAVNLQDMTLGADSIGFSSTMAIADTGTSLFYVPTAAAQGIQSKVEAATSLFGSFSTMQGISCAMAKSGVTAAQIDSTLPPLTLTFNDESGQPFTVSAPATRSYLLDVGGGGWCIGVVDNAQLGFNVTLMGDMGLRGFVTVFDRVHQRVGFAPDQGCATKSRRQRTTPTWLRERGHLPAL